MTDSEEIDVLEQERRRKQALRDRGEPDPAAESAKRIAEDIKAKQLPPRPGGRPR